jgi:predicted metal-dependent hydrolase
MGSPNDSIQTFKMKNGKVITGYKPRYVPTGKKPDYSSKYAQKMIAGELDNMRSEIEASQAGQRTITGVGTEMKVTATKSTFPSYMRKAGISSKKDFMKVLSQKRGKRKERLKKIAINRLNEGYKNKHGYDMPDMKFKAKTGQVYDNKDIIFRRIKGRIVPLRIPKRNRYDILEEAPF